MPLFRFHRGGLAESLITTIIVKDKQDLKQKLLEQHYKWFSILSPKDFDIEIEPYPTINNNFDSRIGWYTYIVLVKMLDQPTHPIGFLSEPLDD